MINKYLVLALLYHHQLYEWQIWDKYPNDCLTNNKLVNYQRINIDTMSAWGAGYHIGNLTLGVLIQKTIDYHQKYKDK